jgi:hypothetical protein
MGSSAACSACHRRMPKPLRRSANSCALSTASGATGRPICPQGGALPGGAAAMPAPLPDPQAIKGPYTSKFTPCAIIGVVYEGCQPRRPLW